MIGKRLMIKGLLVFLFYHLHNTGANCKEYNSIFSQVFLDFLYALTFLEVDELFRTKKLAHILVLENMMTSDHPSPQANQYNMFCTTFSNPHSCLGVINLPQFFGLFYPLSPCTQFELTGGTPSVMCALKAMPPQ